MDSGDRSVIRMFARRPQAARGAALRLCRLPHAQCEDAGAWHELGMALNTLGDRAGAFAAFRNAARLDADRPNTRRALGNLLFDLGQPDLALRCFDGLARR